MCAHCSQKRYTRRGNTAHFVYMSINLYFLNKILIYVATCVCTYAMCVQIIAIIVYNIQHAITIIKILERDQSHLINGY